MLSILILLFQCVSAQAATRLAETLPIFPPCSPESEFMKPVFSSEPSPQFCSKWSPDFIFNGNKCCGRARVPGRKKRSKGGRCSPKRIKASYCDEMTAEQMEYSAAATSGKLGDILSLLTQEMGKRGDQAYCTVNNGFLAYGRRVIPSSVNRLIIQSPQKCLNFGTDAMAGMLEWVGREISKNYSGPSLSGVNLVIGNISAPRGGCKKGHASHTSGQDADIGFLTVNKNSTSPIKFHRQFDSVTNWWLLKKIFKNPFACIKAVFLDRRHIRALSKFAMKDPEWKVYQRFIRHMPGHGNHLHIRIGNGPGQPGCSSDAKPELEFEEDGDSMDDVEISVHDELKSRQSTDVQERF